MPRRTNLFFLAHYCLALLVYFPAFAMKIRSISSIPQESTRPSDKKDMADLHRHGYTMLFQLVFNRGRSHMAGQIRRTQRHTILAVLSQLKCGNYAVPSSHDLADAIMV